MAKIGPIADFLLCGIQDGLADIASDGERLRGKRMPRRSER